MGAFDKLQNYSARRSINETSEVFDTSTPDGCFLSRVHKEGYKMYDFVYRPINDPSKPTLSEEEFSKLEPLEQAEYTKSVEYTELHNVLTTYGNQKIDAIAGAGKALMNGSLVMTQFGYQPIETLKVGDMVYGEDGKLHAVLGVFPQGKKRVNKITFSDNSVISCCEDHLWTVRDKSGKFVTVSVADMIASGSNNSYILPSSSYLHIDNGESYTDTEAFLIAISIISFCMHSYVPDLNYFNSCIEIGRRKGLDLPKYFTGKDLSFLTEKGIGYFLDFYGLNSKILFMIRNFLSMFLESDSEEGRYLPCANLVQAKKMTEILDYAGVRVGRVVNFDNETIRLYITDCFHITAVVVTNEMAEMTCITVDNPSSLFLTNHCIPTHNTTALVFKIMYDIITGEAVRLQEVPGGNVVRIVDNMWVCTFLRTGAEELKNALIRQQYKLGYTQTADQISFSTLDAEFKRCLNAMGVATNIGKPEQLAKLFRDAINSCGVTRTDGMDLTKEDYRVLTSIIEYCRGRLDNKRYMHPSCKDYGLTKSIMNLIISQFASLRQSAGIMDFTEIQELLFKFLYVTPNKAVQDFVSNRFKYIYIDEFQDTSQLQYAILRFYARGKLYINSQMENKEVQYQWGISNDTIYTGEETKGKIVAIGDPSQCIYSFKGSDSKILVDYFDEDFRPTLCTLSYNYRCPSNILNPVVPSIHQNADSASQKILPAKEGGVMHTYAFNGFGQMVQYMLDDIENDLKQGYRVAVLCRTNYDGIIPAFTMEAGRRFDFSISSESMTMNSPLCRKLINVTSLFIEKSTPAVKDTLTMIAGRGNAYELNHFIQVLKQNSKSIWDIPREDLSYSCRSLVSFVDDVKRIYMPDGVRVRENEVKALDFVYKYLIAKVFNGDSNYSTNAREYISTLLFVLENGNFETVYDFIEELDIINHRLDGRIGKKGANVTVSTVHEFKGKECDSVYVWNDIDGVFPSSKCDVSDEDQLDEERRVHYIACTRAKEKSSIYTLSGQTGLFVREMDVKLTNPVTLSKTL